MWSSKIIIINRPPSPIFIKVYLEAAMFGALNILD